MCRMIILSSSEPTKISHVVSGPSHSLISQSYNCRLRAQNCEKRTLNADGYGIGWYNERDVSSEACILTSILPAWGCGNLDRIVSRTASKLIFAHIRAMTNGSTSDVNCHPFQYGTLLFMHNGNIGSWDKIKRSMANLVSLNFFMHVKGNTDSELAFALFLTMMEESGHDPGMPPANGFPKEVLAQAIRRTISVIDNLVASSSSGPPDVNLLNFAVTDGHCIIATRYVNHSAVQPSSLYYCQGASWGYDDTGHDFIMHEDNDQKMRTVVVASEPLTNGNFWIEIPRDSLVTIEGHQVDVSPIGKTEIERMRHHEVSKVPILQSKTDSQLLKKSQFSEKIYEVTDSCCTSVTKCDSVKAPPLSYTLSCLRQTFQVRFVKSGKKQRPKPHGLVVTL